MQQLGSQRDTKRLALARALGGMTYAELFEFGITRVGNVGGLDVIGIPIFTSVRPGGETVSINAGKSLDPVMSRAGAILEAMEMHVCENPDTEFVMASAEELAANKLVHMEPKDWAPAAGAIVNARTVIPWEVMDVVGSDPLERILVPSDTVWMKPRQRPMFRHWQTSSNGLASGFSRQDAEVSALYELVERDGWTLYELLVEHPGIWPCTVNLTGAGPEIREIEDRILEQSLAPFVVDITTDLRIPVFGCVICDLNPSPAGLFGGYGCSLDAATAIKRAMLEAVQARVCYIAGARDDLFRRSFLLMKQIDQKATAKHFSSLRKGLPITAYEPRHFATVAAEFKATMDVVKAFGARIYSKELWQGNIGSEQASIVRMLSPDLEPARFEHYARGKRAERYLAKVTQGSR